MSFKFPIIKTNSLLLRQFEQDDLENVYKGLSDPDVIRYYGVSFRTLDETKAQLKFFEDLEKNGTGIWWAICTADNKNFYGAAGLNNLVKEHRKAELGYWLLPAYWKKGIVSEVLPLICKVGFNELGLHRIEAQVESENKNSLKVLSRLGFEHEGTMHECEFKNGSYIDLQIFALINKSES